MVFGAGRCLHVLTVGTLFRKRTQLLKQRSLCRSTDLARMQQADVGTTPLNKEPHEGPGPIPIFAVRTSSGGDLEQARSGAAARRVQRPRRYCFFCFRRCAVQNCGMFRRMRSKKGIVYYT